MQLDWFTLVAQIVNFLILLYLLHRFLYQPVLQAMNARQERIAEEIQQAEEKHEEAEQRAASYKQQREDLEEKRDQMLKEMKQEVEEQREKLLDDIKKDIQEKKQDWVDALQQNQESFIRELKIQLGQKAAEIARRALDDLADANFERQMVSVFIQEIRSLDSGQRSEFAELIRDEQEKFEVYSSFKLDQDQKEQITRVIEESILDGHPADSRFEISDELISGIELRLNGQKISWTIKEYLEDLQQQIEESIAKANQVHLEERYAS